MAALLLRRIGEESPDARELASRRRGAEALPSPVRQERAKIGGAEPEQPCRGDLLTAVAAKEINEPVRRRYVSAHRMRRAAAVMPEMVAPMRRERGGRVN